MLYVIYLRRVTQVMPDWRVARVKGDGSLHDEALNALRDRTAKAANPSLLTDTEKKRKTPPMLKQDYQSNKHGVMALENAL